MEDDAMDLRDTAPPADGADDVPSTAAGLSADRWVQIMQHLSPAALRLCRESSSLLADIGYSPTLWAERTKAAELPPLHIYHTLTIQPPPTSAIPGLSDHLLAMEHMLQMRCIFCRRQGQWYRDAAAALPTARVINDHSVRRLRLLNPAWSPTGGPSIGPTWLRKRCPWEPDSHVCNDCWAQQEAVLSRDPRAAAYCTVSMADTRQILHARHLPGTATLNALREAGAIFVVPEHAHRRVRSIELVKYGALLHVLETKGSISLRAAERILAQAGVALRPHLTQLQAVGAVWNPPPRPGAAGPAEVLKVSVLNLLLRNPGYFKPMDACQSQVIDESPTCVHKWPQSVCDCTRRL